MIIFSICRDHSSPIDYLYADDKYRIDIIHLILELDNSLYCDLIYYMVLNIIFFSFEIKYFIFLIIVLKYL